MALRNKQSVTIRPKGVSDAQDGTNAFPGAMTLLQNLVLAYHTDNVFVPRPAGFKVIDFTNPTFSKNTTGNTHSNTTLDNIADASDLQPGMTITGSGIPANTTISSIAGTSVTMSAAATATATGVAVTFASPANANGIISEFIVVGTRVYGMVSSSLYNGKDEPFCYDLAANQFITLAGVQSSLLPASLNSTGEWVPPVMRAINNVNITLAHTGFVGGGNPYFGWIDTSGLNQTILGNTALGSNVLDSVYTTVGNSAPILQGIQPGQLINNANFPAGTYVLSATNGTFSLNTTGNTHATTTLDGLASTTGVKVGMTVSGAQFASGTYVTAIVSGTQVTLNQAALGTATGATANFAGGGTVTLSANATATGNLVNSQFTGGTSTKPRWGAGNTNTNPLATVPKCVYGFNGRCYYGAGSFLVYSDPQLPQQVSQSSQALQLGDNTDITALAGVPLTSQLSGGVQQSMTVFKGAGPLWQITGDATSNNLAENVVKGSVGTLAPRSIVETPNGTTFMAVDGLRVLGLSGTLSEPMNVDGAGVSTPYLNALYQSRIVAAYAENIYRATVQDASQANNPINEYWFDINKGVWTGPHSITSRASQPYTSGASFLVAPLSTNGQIWRSDAIPNFNSTYTENGARIQCAYETVILPDNDETHWNKVVQGTLTFALANSDTVNVSVYDDRGNTLGTCSFNGVAPQASVWGSFQWGAGTWGSPTSPLREYFLKWTNPMTFRQARLAATFQAASQQAVGNLYIPIQPVKMNDV